MKTISRRNFLTTVGSLTALASLQPYLYAGDGKRPKVLLRSSWQMVNIGDIAHSPGMLTLLEKYIPESDVTLWHGGEFWPEVQAMEQRRFPKLQFVSGKVKPDLSVPNAQLQKAIDEADFVLHGSSSGFAALFDVQRAAQRNGKRYGFYGCTYTGTTEAGIEALSNAAFYFARNASSVDVAREAGVKCPVMEFGPDAAFACDLRNDEAALKFLSMNQLQPDKFVCCIPRLRWTPYWKIRNKKQTDQDREKWDFSQKMRGQDHAPLRQTIERILRETDLKVLICPEDMSQMEVGKLDLYDPLCKTLPDDLKARLVWRPNYWLTDEAISVYVRSAGLFGLEMHSPIMCVGNGIPAVVCRFKEQTIKGFMWRDIGLGDWLFDMDVESQTARIADTVLDMLTHPEQSAVRVQQAQKIVQKRQEHTMAILRRELGLSQR